MCRVSFVTSVYNCEDYIYETIQSVLSQSYTDWEYIIIDDNSSDGSVEEINRVNDHRIRLVQNNSNKGQSNNLNYGISVARGEYIARLDHDDICYPDRIEKQLEYMDKHPDTVLCGCLNDYWENGVITHAEKLPIVSENDFRFSLLFGNYVICHSSFFIKRSAMINNNIWYKNYRYSEDYALLLDLLKYGNIGCVQAPLVAYRVFPEQFTQTCGSDLIKKEEEEIKTNYLDYLEYKSVDFRNFVLERTVRTQDYEECENEIVSYATNCNIDTNVSTAECLKYVYQRMLALQGHSMAVLRRYVKSKYLDNRKLISIKGIIYIILCVFKV